MAAMKETITTTAMTMLIMMGAMVFCGFLAITGLPAWMADTIGGMNVSKYVILLVMTFIYMILGMFMDGMAMTILTVPIFLPVVQALGWNAIWFGIYIIIVMEIILVVVPMVYLWFGEYSELPFGQRFFASLFQAVTPRTAGFNTTDYNDFSGTGVVMTIILMLIGGAPGSTAGGMKITTIAVLFFTMIAFFKREKSPAVFKRRITNEAVTGAVAVFMLDLIITVFGAMAISKIKTLFESASAVATVGLTMGITTQIGSISKIILMILMYTGRVGGLTLVFAAVTRKSLGNRQYPADNIAVG